MGFDSSEPAEYDWTTGISKTVPLGYAPNPGVCRCLCCGEDHYGPVMLCTACREHGCEATDYGIGDGLGFWYCDRTDSGPLASADVMFCGTAQVHGPHEWVGLGEGALCDGLTEQDVLR